MSTISGASPTTTTKMVFGVQLTASNPFARPAGIQPGRCVHRLGPQPKAPEWGGLKGMLILADGSCPLAVSWTLNDSRLARVGNTASTTHTSASCARKSTASVLCTPLTSPSHANALLLEAALQQSPGLVGHGVRESLLRRQSRRRRRRFRESASPLWQSQCRRRRFKELLSPLQPQRGR